jgi:hypothetical protein
LTSKSSSIPAPVAPPVDADVRVDAAEVTLIGTLLSKTFSSNPNVLCLDLDFELDPTPSLALDSASTDVDVEAD